MLQFSTAFAPLTGAEAGERQSGVAAFWVSPIQPAFLAQRLHLVQVLMLVRGSGESLRSAQGWRTVCLLISTTGLSPEACATALEALHLAAKPPVLRAASFLPCLEAATSFIENQNKVGALRDPVFALAAGDLASASCPFLSHFQQCRIGLQPYGACTCEVPSELLFSPWECFYCHGIATMGVSVQLKKSVHD